MHGRPFPKHLNRVSQELGWLLGQDNEQTSSLSLRKPERKAARKQAAPHVGEERSPVNAVDGQEPGHGTFLEEL